MRNPLFTPVGKIVVFSVIVFNAYNYFFASSHQNDDLINEKRSKHLIKAIQKEDLSKKVVIFNNDHSVMETPLSYNEASMKLRKEHASLIIKKWKRRKNNTYNK